MHLKYYEEDVFIKPSPDYYVLTTLNITLTHFKGGTVYDKIELHDIRNVMHFSISRIISNNALRKYLLSKDISEGATVWIPDVYEPLTHKNARIPALFDAVVYLDHTVEHIFGKTYDELLNMSAKRFERLFIKKYEEAEEYFDPLE